MRGMRNRAKEQDLISKRNKAYKDANRYEAQLRKEMGMPVEEDLMAIEEYELVNLGTPRENKQDDINNSAKEIARIANEARGFVNKQVADPRVNEMTASEKLAESINKARGL